MKLQKRGQAVSEFLYVYGYVLLGVAVILVVLFYMGVSNFSFAVSESCSFNGGLECRDFTYEEETLGILVRNQMEFSIFDVNLTLHGRSCDTIPSNLTYTINHGGERLFYIPCNLTPGSHEIDLIANFGISETNRNHTKVGRIVLEVRE